MQNIGYNVNILFE